MHGAEDGRGKFRPIRFAQIQSRLRREKPLDRQSGRPTIAPWLPNTKLDSTGAMMVYGLEAKFLHRLPQVMEGIIFHTHSIPCVCQLPVSPAEGYLERSTLEPSAGYFPNGASKSAICTSWLIVSSRYYHQTSSSKALPSAAGSVSSCRPARKIRQMEIVDKAFKKFAFPAPATLGLGRDPLARTRHTDSRMKLANFAAACCALGLYSLLYAQASFIRP